MIQKGLVTSVCNLLLPSMHYSPGPVGPLCDPLLSQRARESERKRERRDRAIGDEHWGKIENIRCLVVWCLTEMELTWALEANSSSDPASSPRFCTSLSNFFPPQNQPLDLTYCSTWALVLPAETQQKSKSKVSRPQNPPFLSCNALVTSSVSLCFSSALLFIYLWLTRLCVSSHLPAVDAVIKRVVATGTRPRQTLSSSTGKRSLPFRISQCDTLLTWECVWTGIVHRMHKLQTLHKHSQ